MANPDTNQQALEVLVVEDDNLSAQLVESVLKTMGVSNIDIAVNGSKALTKVKLKRERYYMIASHLDVPIMNGLDYAKRSPR